MKPRWKTDFLEPRILIVLAELAQAGFGKPRNTTACSLQSQTDESFNPISNWSRKLWWYLIYRKESIDGTFLNECSDFWDSWEFAYCFI